MIIQFIELNYKIKYSLNERYKFYQMYFKLDLLGP